MKGMKLKMILFSFFILFSASVYCQAIARVEKLTIQSKALNQERELLIYTPVDYDWRKHEYFNVLYVFDSQNREFFDYTSSILSFLPNNGKSFIVVGITSPYIKEIDYSRNNDFLPVQKTAESKSRFGKYAGNADNFLAYVASEVIPFVNSKYRTLNAHTAVGHSLGASFILYSLTKKPNLFQNYIAISPNLAYDAEVLSKDLISFDYQQIKHPTFLYLSHADEGMDYWKEWKPAREKLYAFYNSTFKAPKLKVEIAAFPANDHLNTFPPSLNSALSFYFKHIQKEQEQVLSEEKYEVTIKLRVKNKDDKMYITGNQPNLGDWNPSKLEMKKVSDFERQIVLTLQSPAQFKFTKGSWDTEQQVNGTFTNVTIKPETKKAFEFEILED